MQRAETPAREVLVRLIVNGHPLSHFLCSPESLRELAVGWLFTQKLLPDIHDLRLLRVCPRSNDIEVSLGSELRPVEEPVFALTSGCGGGRVETGVYREAVPVCGSPLRAPQSAIRRIMGEMYAAFARHKGSAGMHCAGLCGISDSDRIAVACDIGRHNAVDKVIGRGLLEGRDFTTSVLVTSGRISSDMMFKAIHAQIPIVASQHSVTSMAVELAEFSGIALLGRLNRQRHDAYGKTDRLVEEP
ncbi:MAG: formate dehydrogenase accessory sulfurtransferase FdhD [Candidatus Zixiibacteriota bacterium]